MIYYFIAHIFLGLLMCWVHRNSTINWYNRNNFTTIQWKETGSYGLMPMCYFVIIIFPLMTILINETKDLTFKYIKVNKL
jgi:hypothetical protein